uniref:Uncharacterized protein n=1 Tax=Anguilla anguilla TaxID=7936 RepID=A0A0E9PBK9_ANGAN
MPCCQQKSCDGIILANLIIVQHCDHSLDFLE